MLSDDEATLFRLLSVFAGNFDWDDVAYMATLRRFNAHTAAIVLGSLVSKSLISAEVYGEKIVYRLSDTARNYAVHVLSGDAWAREAHFHHASLVLKALEQSSLEWSHIEESVWRSRYESRLGDLRKALNWCFGASGDTELGVQLAVAGIRLWNEHSSIFEQLFEVDRALAHCGQDPASIALRYRLEQSRAYNANFAKIDRNDEDKAWEVALSSAEASGDATHHLAALYGKAIALIYSGRNTDALELMDDFMKVAEANHDLASRLDGARVVALARIHLGEVAEAKASLEQLQRDLQQGIPPSKITRFQQERHASVQSKLALATWLTGDPDRATVLVDELLSEVSQIMGQAYIVWVVGLPMTLWNGQRAKFERYLGILDNSLATQSVAMWEPALRFYTATLRHLDGQSEALADMRLAIDALVDSEILMRTPMYAGVLAEALLREGKIADAEQAIERALSLEQTTNEHWCLPELLRVKAAVLMALGQEQCGGEALVAAGENAAAAGARFLEDRVKQDIAGESPRQWLDQRRPDAGPAAGAC